MYGLKPDFDLSFFIGKELTQVAVGLCDVQLHFHEQVSLSITSQTEHTSKDGVMVWDGDKKMPTLASSLLSLIGTNITSVEGLPDGTLTLGFSNQEVLVLYDDSSHYESYTIRHGDDLFVV